MIFPYQKLLDKKYAPIAPLYLRGRRRWLYFNAFVDTGADYSVFHADVAAMLGIRLDSGEKISVTVGDGDSMAIYLHTINVRFADYVFDARVAFSAELGAGFNLLGRASFFEKFQFCFNERRRVINGTKFP